MSSPISSHNGFENVLVVGATGRLGALFVKELLASPLGFNVNLLIRQSATRDEKKMELIQGFVTQGAKVIEGDISLPESLPQALKGIDLVLCLVSNAALIAEVELVRACKAAGVKRYIPAQFGVNLYGLTEADLPSFDDPAVSGVIHTMLIPKLNTLRELERLKLEYVYITTNIWLEVALESGFAAGLDAISGGAVIIPNDGNDILSLTSVTDVPRLALPAIIHPTTANTQVTIAAENHTWLELAAIAEKELGKSLHRTYVDEATANAMISNAEGFSKLVFWFIKMYQSRPERSDFSKSAFNLTHPELYTAAPHLTVTEFFRQVRK